MKRRLRRAIGAVDRAVAALGADDEWTRLARVWLAVPSHEVASEMLKVAEVDLVVPSRADPGYVYGTARTLGRRAVSLLACGAHFAECGVEWSRVMIEDGRRLESDVERFLGASPGERGGPSGA